MKRGLKKFWDTLTNETLMEIDTWTFQKSLNPMFAIYLIDRGIMPMEIQSLIEFLRSKGREQGNTMQKIASLSLVE